MLQHVLHGCRRAVLNFLCSWVQGLKAELLLQPRQDLLMRLIRLVSPIDDRVDIEVSSLLPRGLCMTLHYTIMPMRRLMDCRIVLSHYSL